jgi:hypothetical protein
MSSDATEPVEVYDKSTNIEHSLKKNTSLSHILSIIEEHELLK